MLLKTQSLRDMLVDRIRSYKIEHGNIASSKIAKKLNISTSAFNRIENGDVLSPSLDITLKILRGTDCKNILQYLEHYFPEIYDLYQREYKELYPFEVSTNTYLPFFQNEEYCRLMLLAINNEGIALNSIRDNYGNFGLRLVEELLKLDFFYIDNDKLKFKSSKNFRATLKEAKAISINSIINFYDPSDSLDCAIQYDSQSLNVRKVERELNILMQYIRDELDNIFHKEDNHGDEPFYFTFSAGSMRKLL